MHAVAAGSAATVLPSVLNFPSGAISDASGDEEVNEPMPSEGPSYAPELGALPMGLSLFGSGEAGFRVWAPHAHEAFIQLREDSSMHQLQRVGDHHCATFPPGTLKHGTEYRVMLKVEDGRMLERRDPYARQAEADTAWCSVDDPTLYSWRNAGWERPAFDRYIIYQLHLGSWTPEGTYEAAMAKLKHVADLGFTAVQVLPISQHSDPWGYNPTQPCALHGPYGSADQLRAFVDEAHRLGLAVIVDVVLHHGAPSGNQLWDYDGWEYAANGGIYHENAPDTRWGRSWSFWKGEVVDMLESACANYLGAYNCDGLRFDSANDLPHDFIKTVTHRLHSKFPGCYLTAEVTPENPDAVHVLGFDALWVHSGFFDIIQQHRALGRGHHGGGDWAEGWNLPRLRTAMGMHYGFTHPAQCIKYITGSHDQVGCQHDGKWYEDYSMVGGRHRYAADMFGGGRSDGHAMASVRAWYCAGVGAAGIPMMFMGTEWAQPGWWHTDEHHRPNWDMATDQFGAPMMRLVTAVNGLRAQLPAMRYGWCNILHEDRANGVMAFERRAENEAKVVVVVNMGRAHWQGGQYGVWAGDGGYFQEVLCTQATDFGGWEGWKSNSERGTLQCHDGKLWLNVPPQCCLVFKSVLPPSE